MGTGNLRAEHDWVVGVLIANLFIFFTGFGVCERLLNLSYEFKEASLGRVDEILSSSAFFDLFYCANDRIPSAFGLALEVSLLVLGLHLREKVAHFIDCIFFILLFLILSRKEAVGIPSVTAEIFFVIHPFVRVCKNLGFI